MIIMCGFVIPASAGSCTVDTCHSVGEFKDIMDQLDKLSQTDLDRICIELIYPTSCNKLRRDNKLTTLHIAQQYFNLGVYWEDFIMIVKLKYENPRLANEIYEKYIKDNDSSTCSNGHCNSGRTPVILQQQKDKATVLLVGSTGNGKSALGNFLLDPTDEEKLTKQDKQYFTTATDLQPHTKTTVVKSEHVSYKSHSGTLTVVDTPGLNDVKDFENMIKLMKKLEDLKEIHACIVVVKFDKKIDNQYKETMEYYYKLLPNLFKRNLIVVVTHYFQDKESIKRRERAGIGEEVVKRDTLNALRETCNLPSNPSIFMIDSVPSEDDTVSKTVRDEILEYVFGQEPTIPQFQVAKPRSIMQRDKTEYDRLVQKATKESHQTYSSYPTLQHERDSMDNQISNIQAEKRHFELKRDELDTEELVDYVTWSTKKDHEWAGVPSDKFHLSTYPYKIRKINKGGSEEVHWRREERTDYTYSGKVVGERFHGFRAHIELQVYKRDKFEKEISSFKQKIQEKENLLDEKMQDRARLFARHEQIFKEKGEDLIEKARKQYQYYLDEYMTPDQAIQRLQEIKSSS